MKPQSLFSALAVTVSLLSATAFAVPKPAAHELAAGTKAQLAVLGGLHAVGQRIAAGDAKIVARMERLKGDFENPADMAKVNADATKVGAALADVAKLPIPEVGLVAGIGEDVASGVADLTAPSKGASGGAKAGGSAPASAKASAAPKKEFVTVSKNMSLKDGVVVVTKTQVASADVAKYLQGQAGADTKTTVTVAAQ